MRRIVRQIGAGDDETQTVVICDDCGREADGVRLVPLEPILDRLESTESAVIQCLEDSLGVEDVDRVFSDPDEDPGWQRGGRAPKSAAEVFVERLQELSQLDVVDDPVNLCRDCYEFRYGWGD